MFCERFDPIYQSKEFSLISIVDLIDRIREWNARSHSFRVRIVSRQWRPRHLGEIIAWAKKRKIGCY